MPAEKNNIRIDTENANSSPQSFLCSVCGFVYNGSEKDFNNLPIEYICINCGATKVNFKPFQKYYNGSLKAVTIS